jgi:foldase protein PrsA
MSFVKFQNSAHGRRGVRIVLLVMAAIFVGGAIWSFGTPMRGNAGGERERAVFSVNGKPVSAAQFWGAFENYRNYFGSGVDSYFSTMYMAVREIVRETVVSGEAKARGITAPADEVETKRQEYVDQQIQRAGDGPQRNRFLVDQDLTWNEYLTKVNRDAKARTSQFKGQIIEDRLKEALAKDVTVSDEDLLAKYRTFEVRHILIKVPTDRDRQSWLDAHPQAEGSESAAESAPESASTESGPNAARNKKPKWLDRSDDQALALAQDLRKRIVEGKEDFAALAKADSDDTYSALEGGSLGSLDYQGLQGMDPDFRAGVVALNEGDVSEPVKSKFGYHIIKVDKRTDKDIPADFEQTKEQLRQAELKTKQQTVYGEKVDEMIQGAKLTFADKEPEIAWALGNRQGERTLAEENAVQTRALQLLQEIIETKTREAASRKGDDMVSSEGLSQYYYAVGSIYKERKLWGDALAAFQKAMESSPTWETKLEVGRCFVELKRNSDAVGLLKAVSEDTPGPQYTRVHQDLFSLFSRIGEEKLASKELKVLQEAQQANPYGGMGGPGGMPLNVR